MCICLKNKAIGFCRRRMKDDYFKITKCESLDFVSAANSERIYPLIYCQIIIDLPEVLFAFDFKHLCFVDRGFTAENAVCIRKHNYISNPQWNLAKNAQLKITIHQKAQQDFVTIGMSHILTDGAGFLQYLNLLASLYNGKNPGFKKNNRDISPIFKNIRVKKPTEQTKQNRKTIVSPLRACSAKKTRYLCLKSIIDPGIFNAIHEKAKKQRATLNDVFLTAFTRVIARLQNKNTIVVPCPADLRKFLPVDTKLSVANMTGMYRRISVEVMPQHTFSQTLAQVSIEMQLQKMHCRCFSGIKALNAAFHWLPHFVLKRVFKKVYYLPPISYTNIGVIDDEQLYFKDCNIKSCYITGTYRFPPDFQLALSTFNSTCTLTCTLIGEISEEHRGKFILDQVKSELLQWLNEL